MPETAFLRASQILIYFQKFSITYRYYRYSTRFVHSRYQVLRYSIKSARLAENSPAIYIAQQRRAVPCLALPRGAVPSCAVISFEHTAGPGIRVVYLSFAFVYI